MFRYLARNRSILLLVLVILMSFLIITSQVRRPRNASLPERVVSTILYPFAEGTAAVKNALGRAWGNYAGLAGARDENAKLRKENRDLYLENLRLREALLKDGETAALGPLLGGFGCPHVTARVIGRDASSWFKTAWIDKGSPSGIARDMPAATKAGVVGRVTKVSGWTSRITLITDPSSAVSCITRRTREPGILVGEGGGLCRFQYVGKSADVKAGDLLITSGLDRVFPEGMPVGWIVSVSKAGQGYFQDIEVRPAADIKRFEAVAILLYKPSPIPPEPAPGEKGVK